jgi:hypothetical protein
VGLEMSTHILAASAALLQTLCASKEAREEGGEVEGVRPIAWLLLWWVRGGGSEGETSEKIFWALNALLTEAEGEFQHVSSSPFLRAHVTNEFGTLFHIFPFVPFRIFLCPLSFTFFSPLHFSFIFSCLTLTYYRFRMRDIIGRRDCNMLGKN